MRAAPIALGLLILALSCVSVCADEPPPEPKASEAKAQKIRKLLDLPGPAKGLLEGLPAHYRRLPGMTPAELAKIDELFDREELIDLVVDVYARHMDEEVVDALLAFYSTPAGQRAAQAMADMTADMREALGAWGKAFYQRVQQEVREAETARVVPAAGVVVGEGVLRKETFAEVPKKGVIYDIRRGDLASRAGLEIGLAGTRGAVLADDATRSVVVADVKFDSRARSVGIVDVEGDGVCEFVERQGGWDVRNFGGSSERERDWDALDLVDHQGHVRWSYGGESEARTLAAGDLDGDGTLEFVVGLPETNGLHVVNSQGDRLRTLAGETVWHVEVADLDGDGTREIVYSDAAGRLHVVSAQGDILRRLTLPEPVRSFTLLPPATVEAPTRILTWTSKGAVLVTDGQGRTVKSVSLPKGTTIEAAWGTSVRFVGNGDPYFALLVHYTGPEVSFREEGVPGGLYVFDGEGKLLFQEVFERAGSALASVPEVGTHGEELLVADHGHVWAYRWRPATDDVAVDGVVAAVPGLPDAARAMDECFQAVAGQPVTVQSMRVTERLLEARIQAADEGAFDGVRAALEGRPYFEERARVARRVVEVGTLRLTNSRWQQDVRLRFNEEWVDPRPLREANIISPEHVGRACREAGIRVVWRSTSRETPSPAGGTTLSQLLELESEHPDTEPLTIAMLERLLEGLAADRTHRVTEIQWKRAPPSADAPDAPDRIVGLRLEIKVWRELPPK